MRVTACFCLLAVISGRPGEAQPASHQLFMFATSGSTPVMDLTMEELVVDRSGTECSVVALQPVDGGMKVALLVDNSEAASAIVPLRDGLARFLDALPARHQVGLFTIAAQTLLRTDFTHDRVELRRKVGDLFPVDRTRAVMIDGLMETWRRNFDDDDAWPVFVLVLHDGEEASRRMQDDEYNDFMRELVAGGAMVHVVIVSTGGVGAQTALSINITGNTGGLYKSAVVANALPAALEELGTAMGAHYNAFQNTYRLVFECDPEHPDGETRVTVSRPGVAATFFDSRRMAP
jgi:hypothetical protein